MILLRPDDTPRIRSLKEELLLLKAADKHYSAGIELPLKPSFLPPQESEPASATKPVPTATPQHQPAGQTEGASAIGPAEGNSQRNQSQAPPTAQTGPGLPVSSTQPAAQEIVQLSTAEQARQILSGNVPERRVVYVDSRQNVIIFFSANLFYTGHTAFPLDVYMAGLVDEGGPQDGDVFVFLGDPPRNFFATWREHADVMSPPNNGTRRPLGVPGGPLSRQ